MEINRLNSDIISKIRSSFNISNVAQCVFELVCNSLDSKPTSIAVRINLIKFKIQVADNGEGITRENLELLGIRYMTSKCHNLEELEKHLNTYGFRGEAIASIVEMCKSVSISSRCKNSSETYNKILTKDLRSQVILTKHRASAGTTVTVLGFLNNFPVRRQRVIQEIELEEVKKCMENLVIINPGTSFSLRNDVTGLLILNSPKSSDIIESFRHLHPEISDFFTLLKVSKSKVAIEALIHKEFIFSKKFQYVYVNKRPVVSHKILTNVNRSFYKKMQLETKRSKNPIYETKKYPVYILNIRCPQSYVDVFMGPSKSDVEFKCWDLVFACFEKIIKTFFGLDDKKEYKLVLERKHDAKASCGVSQVFGAVQACAYKRKSDETISDNEDNFKAVNGDFKNDVESKPVGIKKNKVTRLEENKVSKANKKNKNKLRNFVNDKTVVMIRQSEEISGNYQIEDSGKQKHPVKRQKLKYIIKKPLPIKIKPKISDLSKMDLENVFKPKPTRKPDQPKEIDSDDSRNEKEPSFDHQVVPKYQFDQKSVYSRLNTDEDQGKNLIMDMFLKSTQVFTGQDGESAVVEKTCINVSGETVEESNFVMENEIQDTVRGINTTMSINVNVKKKKMKNFDNKCVQTSIIEDRLDKFISKCVQTSQKPTLARVRSNLSNLTQKFDGFQLSHNIDDENIFKFGKGDKHGVLELEDENNDSAVNTVLKENLFANPNNQVITKIIKNHNNQKYYFNNKENEAVFKKPESPIMIVPNRRMENQIYENKIIKSNLNFRGVRQQPDPKAQQNINACEGSPYFAKNALQRQPRATNLENRASLIRSSYKDFQPKFKSTQFQQNCLQRPQFDNNLNIVRNDVIASPYFTKIGMKKQVLSHSNDVYKLNRVADHFFPLQSDNNQLPNHLNEGFLTHNSNLLHCNEQRHNAFAQNCPKIYNITETNPVQQNIYHMGYNDHYSKVPSTDCVPHLCCHEHFRPSKAYLENDQHFTPLQNNANNFGRQNCCTQKFGHYQRDHYHKNQENLNIVPSVTGICHQTNLFCPEQCIIDRNVQPCFERKSVVSMQNLYNVQNQDNIDIIHENTVVEVGDISTGNLNFHKNKSQSVTVMEEKEHNFELEEPWYTPNVSDENMYFDRTLSEPEESGHGTNAVVFGNLKNLSSKRNNQKTDEETKASEEKKKFNFKFGCTPDIFSSGDFCEAWKNSDVNEETIDESGVLEKIKHENFKKQAQKNFRPDFNNFFNLASFGILGSNDAERTTNTVCPSSNLDITLVDDQEKQNIIRKELMYVEKSNRKRFFSYGSESQMDDITKNTEKFEKSRVIMDSQNVWVRKHNETGRGFYVNKRTGMVTAATPKMERAAFCFERRLDFVPKGMSPILKEHKKIDRSLSQNAKSKLHDFILESYENELMIIKWQNFIYDDPQTFFKEIYKEKTKQFENGIPNIQDNNMKKKFQKDNVGFNNKMFETIEVIGQVDKKFIAVLETTKKVVILFDQHAVHERIRAEQFLKEYKGVKAPCKEKLVFFMPRNDLCLLKNHSPFLDSLGLDVEFFTDGLKIFSIPLCLQGKFNSQDNSEDLNKIINTLIKEIIEFLKETRGSTSQLPKIIHNVINLKACRGAIKFGDSLTKEECIELLQDLAKCNLPFQCAHGRPTLTPVLTLSKIELKKKREKPNLKQMLH